MEKMKDQQRKQHIKTFFTLFISILLFFSYLSIRSSAEETPNNIILVQPTDDLQQQINNAKPHQTLQLTAGTYTQQLSINKPLTLTSANPKTTLISATTLPNQPAISITSEQVIIKNLTIQNNAEGIYTTGIRITAEHTIITDCIIHHTPVGIAIWTSNNTITKTRFQHCSDEGIVLLTTSYATCQNNTISHCIFTHNCDAIELQQSSHNKIINCTMKNNTHSGIDAIIKNNNHNIISHCTITDNRVHGIYLAASSNNLITSCSIQNNNDGNIIQPNSFQNMVINQTQLDQQKNQLLQQNQNQSETTPSILLLIKQKITNIQLHLLNLLQNILSSTIPS